MGRKDHQIVVGLALCLLSFFASCKKDKPDAPDKPGITDSASKLYIVCEGSLGNGNASLDMYDLSTGKAYEDVYKSANGTALGDVFQSMTRIGDRLFLCVNNSDKIVVLNAADHKHTGTISIPKPRYILPVSDSKAYVSTLFSNKVYIINPSTLEVKGSVNMPAQNPEGMLLHEGKVLVCGWDTASDKVFVIDTASDAVERTIAVAGRALQEVMPDKNGNLWVLAGNVEKKKVATLTLLNSNGSQILRSYIFPAKADPIRLVSNAARDVLYFIEANYYGGTANNGVYRMSITDNSLPAIPLIQADSLQYYWGLQVEPVTDRIFVGDPKGFTQRGTVSIYDKDGNRLSSFATGVGPGHFYFDRK